MSMLLFTFPVRGSEGLYMVNGPPAFTESTAFQRYCYSDGLWPCVQKKCPNLEGTHRGQWVQIWTGFCFSDFLLRSKCWLKVKNVWKKCFFVLFSKPQWLWSLYPCLTCNCSDSNHRTARTEQLNWKGPAEITCSSWQVAEQITLLLLRRGVGRNLSFFYLFFFFFLIPYAVRFNTNVCFLFL